MSSIALNPIPWTCPDYINIRVRWLEQKLIYLIVCVCVYDMLPSGLYWHLLSLPISTIRLHYELPCFLRVFLHTIPILNFFLTHIPPSWEKNAHRLHSLPNTHIAKKERQVRALGLSMQSWDTLTTTADTKHKRNHNFCHFCYNGSHLDLISPIITQTRNITTTSPWRTVQYAEKYCVMISFNENTSFY